MILCSILLWLAIAALVMVGLLALIGRRAGGPLEALGKWICAHGCATAVVLDAIAGAILAWFACHCGPELARALGEQDGCVRAMLAMLLLLVVVLAILLIFAAACGQAVVFPGIPVRRASADTKLSRAAAVSTALTLPVLVVLLMILLARCCGLGLRQALLGDACASLFGLAIAVFLLAMFAWALWRSRCRPPSESACARVRPLLYLATLLALAAALLVWRCCDHLHRKDFDLAMVGIYWEGQNPGETGAHLRWAFRYGLPFPQGGFDLYRRDPVNTGWNKLNGAPIQPADVWTDGAPAPGPLWQHRAVDRLYPSRWTKFQGSPFADLVAMVGRPPYAPLFFVQEPDDLAFPTPSSPYASQADLDAYLASYRAAESPGHPAVPLAQWQMTPMQMLMVSALDPDIARLLGLLNIDVSADPAVHYDYRVEGHWLDGDRSYTVHDLSKPTTAPLDPPVLTKADTPLTYPTIAGPLMTDDHAVGLRWAPPTASPEFGQTAADGIRPVRWLPRRKDLGVRPCPPPPAPGAAFAALERPDPNGTMTPIAPIALSPQDQGGTLVWPKYFVLDRTVDYRCYAFLVDGTDVFGRQSPPSNVLVADVRDVTGPPPAPNLEARVYDKDDADAMATLSSSEKAVLFPAGTTHTLSLKASWVWPNSFLTTVPDAREFRVLYKISGYQAFSQAANQPLWANPANWTDSGVSVALSAGLALPPRLVQSGVTDAKYYEAIVFDPPMSPDDDHPVVYGFAGVTTVDHAPFSNKGPVTPPVVIFARDFEPPDPPPIPALDNGPDPTDKGANALLTLSWSADGRYLYHLMRAPGRRFASLPQPAGAPPACLAPEAPTCTGTDAPCVEAKRRFKLRVKAEAHPELFGTATMAPAKPAASGSGLRLVAQDKVDATVGGDWLYAGRAIDPAGNVSDVGCPQFVVVKDLLPPRAPTVAQALGMEGAVEIRWEENLESDLELYRVYRTTVAADDGSLERMALVLEAEPDGTAVSPPGAADAVEQGAGTAYPKLKWKDQGVRAGRDLFYRLVAVDHSGNVSELSSSTKARSVDTTPPGPPVWGSPPVQRGTDGSGDFVRIAFSPPPGDPDARFRIQRRETGTLFWRPISEWLPAGTTEFKDRQAPPGRGYTYRVQAMDAVGNVGEFNPPRSVL